MPIQREKTIEELMGGTRGGTPAPFVFNPDTASGRSPYQQQYGETTAQWRARTARPISPTGIDPAESAYLRTTGYDPNAPPPTAEQSYSSTLSMFQQQINALDMEVARKRADIQNRYNVIGQGRLGSQRAIQAQTGMLGQVGGF